MNLETPLEEVANHLSAMAAEHLLNQPYWMQEAVLRMMRVAISTIEQSGCVLDPMQYATVIDQQVFALVAAYEAAAVPIAKLQEINQILQEANSRGRKFDKIKEVLHGG